MTDPKSKHIGIIALFLNFKDKHKKLVNFSIWLMIIYIGTIFYLGYKIPWFDRHPDWPLFSVIEKNKLQERYNTKGNIRIDLLKGRYSKNDFLNQLGFDTSQFDLPESLQHFYAYKPNFIKIDSDRIVKNTFELGVDGNRDGKVIIDSAGKVFEYPNRYFTRFDHTIIRYYQIKIGKNTGLFKIEDNDFFPLAYEYLFQCSTPKKSTDTLYFVFSGDLYMAYVYNTEKKVENRK